MTENNDTRFLLVSGDFSGIQDTVYSISSKGALKSLRARSFMLELLTEHIVYEILKLAGIPTEKPEDYLIRLEKTETGVIYSGGGAFSLLLPYKDKLEGEIKDFADTLNEWALDEFAGKLFIAIHVLPVSSDKLTGDAFSDTRQKQADELEKLKRRKFCNLLEKLLKPEMPKQLSNEDECQITRRDDLPKSKMKKISDMWVTSLSYHLWHLGDHLTLLKKGEKIYRYDYQAVNKEKLKGYLHFPKPDKNYAIYTIEAVEPDKHLLYQYASELYCYSIEEFEPCRKKRWKVGKDFYYAYYVRKVGDLTEYAQQAELKAVQEDRPNIKDIKQIENDTASFHGLAASSCGADLIGALRMDVDNLGKLFSNINDYKKLAKLAKLSNELNYFFKAILNQICEGDFERIKEDFEDNEFVPAKISENDNKKERTVSVIYAGGDDLFIVGAWNEVAELAFDIQKCFDQYCRKYGIENNEGKFATISGGLTLHHPKFPLYQMAKRSGDAEKQAKTWDDNKNRIALFHDEIKEQRHHRLKENKNRYMLSMSWETAHTYLSPLMKRFAKLGNFSEQSDRRKIFVIDEISHQTIEKWFLATEKFQQSGNLYLPTMARIMQDVQMSLSRQNQQTLFCILMKYLYNNPKIAHLHIALNWLSFLRRTR